MSQGKATPLHTSTKSVLVIPTISSQIGSKLWHLSGKWPKAAVPEGTKLEEDDLVFKYAIEDLSSSTGSKLLRDLLNVRSNFDLSLKAPIAGIYHPSDTYFGGVGNKKSPHEVSYASRLAGDNRYQGKNTEIFSQAAACVELIEEPRRARRLGGFEAHLNFFETLEDQMSTVNKWLKKAANFNGNTNDFWQDVEAERERLKQHTCAIIPREELRR